MKRIFLFLLFCSTGFYLPGQSAQQELRAAAAAFRNYENLSMEVSAYVYATPRAASGTLIGKGKMSKSAKGYYSRFQDDEMVANTSCTVIINHAAKTIHIFNDDQRRKRKDSFIPQLDSMNNGNDSMVYRGIVDGMKLVVIYSKNSYVRQTEVYINPSTSLMSRIVYYYAPPTEDYTADAYKSEIVYDKISFDEPDAALFSTEKFVAQKNKTWVAAAAFAQYHLTVVTTPEL